MIGYEVKCYRCSGFEIGNEVGEHEAREHIEDFKAKHRSKCGMGASFSTTIGGEPETLLGVAYPSDVDEQNQ